MTKSKKTAEADVETEAAAPKPLKTNIHAIFGTDERKEEDGAWVSVNEAYGLRIKVRRIKSDTAVKAYDKILKEKFGEGALRKPGDVTAEQYIEVMKVQLATAVLIDWKNLRDADTGEEIPYSLETSLALMEVRDFREFVYQAAEGRDSFREEEDKDAEGN